MTWNADNKEKLQYATAILGFFIGVGLIIADFIMPPPGDIHSTSLYFMGEMMSFCAAVYGISLHYEGELNKIKETIKQEMNKKKE